MVVTLSGRREEIRVARVASPWRWGFLLGEGSLTPMPFRLAPPLHSVERGPGGEVPFAV
jgi:hypothetical protein